MEDNIRTEIINSIINGDIDHASELVETHKPEYLYKERKYDISNGRSCNFFEWIYIC